MGKVIDLADLFPPMANPMVTNNMAEPIAPFLQGDSFERWVLQRNYELLRQPLTQEEMQALREAWGL